MKRFLAAILAAILAAACVVASTPGFARRGHAHGPGLVRDPTTRLGNPAPRMLTLLLCFGWPSPLRS